MHDVVQSRRFAGGRSEPESQQTAEGRIERNSESPLAAIATVHKLRAGETLFVEGDPANKYYEVISGLLKEFNTLKDGCCHISDFRFHGQLVGLSSSGVHHHTAEAIEETCLLSYPAHRFKATVADKPELSRWFAQTVLADLERARSNALALSRLNAMERVARFLTSLSRIPRCQGSPDDPVAIPMSRQDMADHLGLTIETVCRCLSTLRQRALITMPTAHGFVVTDEAAIAAIAGRDDIPEQP